MSDARDREAKRLACAKALPSVEDLAREIRARMRSGCLPRDLVELAAYCEDRAARAVLPRWSWLPRVEFGPEVWAPQPSNIHKHDSLAEFTSGLARWGPMVMARAAVSAARIAVEGVEFKHGPGVESALNKHQLNLVVAWLEDPHDFTAAACYLESRPGAMPRLLWHATCMPWEIKKEGRSTRLKDVVRCASDVGHGAALERMKTDLRAWALAGKE